jgi:nitrate reductase alpha subunit
LPFYPQFQKNPLEVVKEAEASGAKNDEAVVTYAVEQLKDRKLKFSVEDPDAPENWPRVWFIWRGNALYASAKGHEYMLRHYLGTHSNAIAPEQAADSVREVTWDEHAPTGKMDLVVDLNFRMDTSALYSDIILPSASWYEKDDLNTTDLHSYIHPMGAAVPPCWESKPDWEIFRMLAGKLSELAPTHFPKPFRDVVATPLLHDTADEIAQPVVRNWRQDECDAVPGKTMPHLTVVERDYPNLVHRYCSLGPGLRDEGVEDHGVHMQVADLYDEFAREVGAYEWGGARYPSLVYPENAANAILTFAPETNGEVAYRGFQYAERNVGLPLSDLAAGNRGIRFDFKALMDQPHRFLTSPCWTGITNAGRAYTAYAINVERLVPWRTLTGRQHFYLDHEAYRAFGESLPTFKPKVGPDMVASKPVGPTVMLNWLTPHGKWHIHTTYYDDLRMLTLSRGVEPIWLNESDADEIGVRDNDWVEAWNDNGVVVTRAVVSARMPKGVCFLYHSPERTIAFPKSPVRNDGRGGGTNSATRMRLKPVLMAGGYGQHCYRFNDNGPPAPDRDSYVFVHKLEGPPRWH